MTASIADSIISYILFVWSVQKYALKNGRSLCPINQFTIKIMDKK